MEITGDWLKPKQRFEKAIKLEPVDRFPVASPLQTGTVPLMEACGSYWPDAHRKSKEMTKLALAANEVCGIESVRVPFCVTIEVEAMGCVIGGWDRSSQPHVVECAVKGPEDLNKLKVPDPHADGRMPVVIEAVENLSKEVDGKLPVIAAISAPFETTVRLRGTTELMKDVIRAPDILKRMLRITTDTAIEYGRALAEAGADAITLVDGSSGTLGPELYGTFSFPYEREVIEKLDAITILHICGDTKNILDMMAETHADGLSVDSYVRIVNAKEIVKRRAAVIGNVSTTTLLISKPSDVEAEAVNCLRDGVDVLAPACGFPPLTPLDNMRAIVKAIARSP